MGNDEEEERGRLGREAKEEGDREAMEEGGRLLGRDGGREGRR